MKKNRGKLFTWMGWMIVVILMAIYIPILWTIEQEGKRYAEWDQNHCTKWVTQYSKGYHTYCVEHDQIFGG
jgi:hypothetical protein